jgi:Zn-dependent protease
MAMVVAIPLRVIFANPELEFELTAVAATRFLLGVATFFVVINVFLFVFNLLPIPPLDGWKVLLGVVDARTSYTLRRYEQYGILLLLAILLVGGRIIGPIGQSIVRFLLGA